MKAINSIMAKDAFELAHALGLDESDAVEMALRRQLNDKIVEVVKRSGLTHAQVAKLAKTSRSRLTAILNRNTSRVSTDLLLRILGALGYRATLRFVRNRPAA